MTKCELKVTFLASVFALLGGLSLPSNAAEPVKTSKLVSSAPQAYDIYKNLYPCYKLADLGDTVGEKEGDKSLEILPDAVNFNATPIYHVTKNASVTCYVLENLGANDFSWGLGIEPRLDGCYCVEEDTP